ncbi:MAG: nucleoside monophosphate kinase [archaeon]
MIIALIGSPGSGKGTYAQMLAQEGWVHFSMGQALRDHVKKKGPLSKKIDSYTSNGRLVPSSIFFRVFKDAVQGFGKKNLVLDGLPRTIRQATGMEKSLASIHPIDAFLFIDVHVDEVKDRLSKRSQCGDCGMVYGKSAAPKKKGICGRCGGRLSIRKDDTPSVIDERFHVYEKETLPVIEWASKRYLLFHINGHGKPGVVFKRIRTVIRLVKG